MEWGKENRGYLSFAHVRLARTHPRPFDIIDVDFS